jgi:acyl carrier protein
MTDAMMDQLNQYIVTQILKQPKRRLAPDEALISSGLVDSFSLIDLALFVEEQFGAHLDDTELTKDSFDTLEQLVALIEKKISA